KHAKQHEGVDKEEKTMKHHYLKSQRGLQRAFIKKNMLSEACEATGRKGSSENRDPITDLGPRLSLVEQVDPVEPPCPATGHEEGIPRRSISGEHPPKGHCQARPQHLLMRWKMDH
ncbi:hypothetical protein HID58_087145, partial [Brassica napus]